MTVTMRQLRYFHALARHGHFGRAAEDHGFEIDEAEVVYWGRCPDCLAAQ